MANWCNNNLVFEGTEKQIREIDTLFQQMIDKGEQENCGQLPNFIEDGGIYFFDIEKQCEGVYRYETKWRPNIDEVFRIAQKAGITDYTHEYDEMGCLIYGMAVCSNGELTEYDLEDEDFDKYRLNSDKETYTYGEQIYTSEWEILNLILQDKMNNTK